MAADTITFNDCCRMILEDWPFRQETVAPELLEFKLHLLALLNQEFGIEWRDTGKIEALSHHARKMPRQYARIEGPTEGLLETSYQPGEADVHDMHLGLIEDAELALKQRWTAMFRDLLLLRWPEAGHRTTSWSRLHALGLGEPPDMSQYGT